MQCLLRPGLEIVQRQAPIAETVPVVSIGFYGCFELFEGLACPAQAEKGESE